MPSRWDGALRMDIGHDGSATNLSFRARISRRGDGEGWRGRGSVLRDDTAVRSREEAAEGSFERAALAYPHRDNVDACDDMNLTVWG